MVTLHPLMRLVPQKNKTALNLRLPSSFNELRGLDANLWGLGDWGRSRVR
ncbi:hypothetical protein [Synechococcus sp. PCC 6312]|nr:hypothetical protein [Synechococcus sp. PCC 6312]